MYLFEGDVAVLKFHNKAVVICVSSMLSDNYFTAPFGEQELPPDMPLAHGLIPTVTLFVNMSPVPYLLIAAFGNDFFFTARTSSSATRICGYTYAFVCFCQ